MSILTSLERSPLARLVAAQSISRRNFRLTTPLDPKALIFRSLDGFEALGQLGQYRLVALSLRADLALDKVLGHPVTISTDIAQGEVRHLNLHVSEISLAGREGEYYRYEATLRPWLWFLSRTVDCRVFQHQDALDIIRAVLADHANAKFVVRTSHSYVPFDYCVQYRESDYNFVARLCEQEGIYFWFEHAEGAHTLILADALSAHKPAPGYAKVPFEQGGGDGGMTTDREHLEHWHYSKSVQPVNFVLTDYDFEKPRSDLTVRSKIDRNHGEAHHEVFDYPGEYVDPGLGEHYARIRLDEAQARQETATGQGTVRGLPVGSLFTLFDHPRADQNREYLVTSAHLSWAEASYQSGAGEWVASCQIDALPSALPFRPARSTPRPFVQGPQTAVVVGPAGEEIFCDEYGRVKVQFHWDRRGGRNQHSSCWVRSSQPWAGQNFGAMSLPRIGQEVVVSFLEGDPDQPLITGRVYNAGQMPPWDLPANKTQSGILTRSTQGGAYDHANAIRFEDKKGAEELWLHAEKDQRIEVENDESHWVGHDRKKTVDHDETVLVKHDRTETVDNDETITVHNNRKERVDHNETISIGDNRSEDVGKNETVSIGDNRRESVGKNETWVVGENRDRQVGQDETLRIGRNQTINIAESRRKSVGKNEQDTIARNWSIRVGKVKTETIAKGYMQNVGLSRMETVGVAYSLNVGLMMDTRVGASRNDRIGKTLTINAGEKIELVCGKSRLVMTNEDIRLESKTIHLAASSTIHIDGPDDVLLNTTAAPPPVPPSAAAPAPVEFLKA
ncbi:type VI secretion system tip protein VgrG [Chitinimonas arctica]|uniref:Type VI secretion system tip protein VgrG n=1 Tax=Chitinimonas arctica TaxID=2594795 RepID=A0A516SE36_9NEIS|nr:type VI secretion system tip protein VgrG [Chitinimonas arctica]QDQ26419.1 type VI secretion system tip protein VgrG [Chitinimonas arctica]